MSDLICGETGGAFMAWGGQATESEAEFRDGPALTGNLPEVGGKRDLEVAAECESLAKADAFWGGRTV